MVKNMEPLSIRKKNMVTKLILILCLLAGTGAALGIYKSPYIIHEMAVINDFSTTKYLPIKQGSYWLYSYSKTTSINGKLVKQKGQFRMRVLRMYNAPAYSLAVLKGNPLTCDPEELFGYLIYSNKIYYVRSAELNDMESAAKDKQNGGLDLEKAALQFEFPLFKGLSWQSNEMMARNDGKYCWMVDKEQYLEFGRGKHPNIYHTYWLRYVTNPDDTTVRFVPEIGIFSVSYKHHGSRNEFEVLLKGCELK
ncbi:MAG: hypothetical protein ACM3UZ_08985 [Acidobacteriota bacterium]